MIGGGGGIGGGTGSGGAVDEHDSGNKALALMMQPSIDYGKFIRFNSNNPSLLHRNAIDGDNKINNDRPIGRSYCVVGIDPPLLADNYVRPH